jgi:hypothetical protein
MGLKLWLGLVLGSRAETLYLQGMGAYEGELKKVPEQTDWHKNPKEIQSVPRPAAKCLL